jgi:hypothetical protein
MANCENEYNVFHRQPSILRNVAIATAREQEFAATLFGFPTEQRMIGQQFQGSAHAQKLRAGSSWVLFSDEVEEPLEIVHCPYGYFDARHACGLGRRVLAPVRRFSR